MMLETSVTIALATISLAMVLGLWRLWRGPSLPDRIMALDKLYINAAALLIQFAKHGHWGNLVRLFCLLPLYYAKLIAQGLRHGFQPRHRMIPIEWAGCLSGVFFFFRNMRPVKSDDTKRKRFRIQEPGNSKLVISSSQKSSTSDLDLC